jgi:hypothetical protein
MQSASGAKPRRTSRRKGNPEIMEMPELHGLVALRAYQLFEKRGRAHAGIGMTGSVRKERFWAERQTRIWDSAASELS